MFSVLIHGDHLSEKCGSIDCCQRSVLKFTRNKGHVKELSGKDVVRETVYCYFMFDSYMSA